MTKDVLITTGDADGIGLEVTVKALIAMKSLPKKARLIFFRSLAEDAYAIKLINKLKSKHRVHTCHSLEDALNAKKNLIEILSVEPPAQWVEDSAKACFDKRAHAMVTAPLSKQSIAQSGFKDLGHTDILKRVCKKNSAFMGFKGKHFNVVLITGHIPIVQVEKTLTETLFKEAVLAAAQLQKHTIKGSKAKPIALVGLNPHAGDLGLIGGFDETKLKSFMTAAQKNGAQILGPLVPDACFHKENWNKYSLYLCCYHDQGLIPFKMAHGFDSGVHITLGLPIIRTSVDHGTAKDIYGKNLAKPHSMKEALQMALSL